MTDPRPTLKLDGNRRVFRPGEILSGVYAIDHVAGTGVDALEVSVLWSSEGKGDEDLAVHFFTRVEAGEGRGFDPRHPGKFSTLLPNSPLSYDGLIVKIHWCVRVRLFLTDGRETVEERPFQLGSIPAAGSDSP